MPDSSSTTAIITPRSTRPQGSSPPRMPLMMYDISVAFGASNFGTSEPFGSLRIAPLMPGSTKYTGLPASSTRYFSALPPAGSGRNQTLYSLASRPPFASTPFTASRPWYWFDGATSDVVAEPAVMPGDAVPTGTYTE